MNATELKFDIMEYDTTLAKDFLNRHPKILAFYSEIIVNKTADRSIGNEISLSQILNESEINIEVEKKKLWNLSQLIVQNVELFCQLEYMIRGVQPDEVRAFDLKLIVQNILYWSSAKHRPLSPEIKSESIYMKNGSPLVRLARFAEKVIATRRGVDIFSEKDTAIVCWLFAHLCREAGFENQVNFHFVEDIPKQKYELESLLEDCTVGGCYAVVTGKADVDSAVDLLVDAPSRAPWGVRRVLVQENVLERFRRSLIGKARVCPGEVDKALLQRSTSALAINGKVFLVEYAGEGSPGKGIVVEAYRTVKELVSLLGKFRPYALSLWCDSTAESNEIAHSVTADIVWVNSYGEFDGPPQVSQTLSNTPKTIHAHISEDFKRLRNIWEGLDISDRAAKLRDLMNEHKIIDANDSFYCVRDRFTCAGTVKAAGTLVFEQFQDTGGFIIPLLTYVLKGGSIIFGEASLSTSTLCALYVTLKDAGAPVDVFKVGDQIVPCEIRYKHKVIRTSYGTTFAN